jgi:hypothetical protein
MATPNAASDMADFFDFGEAAMPDVPQHAVQNIETVNAIEGLVQDVSLGPPSFDQALGRARPARVYRYSDCFEFLEDGSNSN